MLAQHGLVLEWCLGSPAQQAGPDVVHAFIHSFMHSIIHSLIHSFYIHSCIHAKSLIRSFTHHSLIHSFYKVVWANLDHLTSSLNKVIATSKVTVLRTSWGQQTRAQNIQTKCYAHLAAAIRSCCSSSSASTELTRCTTLRTVGPR